ncbi:DMT family transporter [Sphingoaurantiacus capsulatus]|uniref:DMT family transporter n=1 Tax=Sphingoaurantiacus capsulatus TaxID=1771310 RepID=A0ABV7XFA3_9SPHN
MRGPAALLDGLPLPLRGPAWMIVACIAFALVWALIRAASADLHPFAIVFFRNLIGALIILPIAAGAWNPDTLRRWPAHLRRAGSGVVATYATFFAIAHAPLADVQAINFAAPLFATVAAALFLGEKLRARRIAALVVGFAGVLVVLRPGHLPMTPGIGAAILSALATAFSLITIKQLVGTDDPRLVAAFTFFIMLPISALVLPFYWAWPSPMTWLILVGVGICAVVGQLATSYAFRAAEATAVLPYDFIRFGIVAAIGWQAFGETVDAMTLVGGAVILATSIYLAYREQMAARSVRPASEPPIT